MAVPQLIFNTFSFLSIPTLLNPALGWTSTAPHRSFRSLPLFNWTRLAAPRSFHSHPSGAWTMHSAF
ncbi:hypothetical protein C8R44DRAFT_801371 [Mycena epipterygia]|nr:hypothetical protein C8R44DRAFT_801371 [Mycena epipterygia]